MPRPALHRAVLVATALALAVPLAGCGGPDERSEGDDGAAATHTVQADNGGIEVPRDPERVVAVGYAVPVLIEADAALVGISTWTRGLDLMTPEDRATYDRLEKVGADRATDLDYEAVAAVRPDLIVVGVPAPILGQVDVDQLEKLAPVVAIGPEQPDDWRELSGLQSLAAGRGEEYEAAKQAYDQDASTLREKYATALDGLAFGHVGGYAAGEPNTFMREYAGSWGTNIARDIGVQYPGEPSDTSGVGGAKVSEYPSLETLDQQLEAVDVITYTVGADGTPSEQVQDVLDSPLWEQLPAVRASRAFPVRYTEAATYPSARRTLASLDEALTPLLSR